MRSQARLPPLFSSELRGARYDGNLDIEIDEEDLKLDLSLVFSLASCMADLQSDHLQEFCEPAPQFQAEKIMDR